jgi:hypothetical protein
MGLVRTARNTHKSPLSPLRDIHKKHKKIALAMALESSAGFG